MAVDCTWSAGPDLPTVGVRAVGIYFLANGNFYAVGGRTSDVAGSDFQHVFRYSPASNTWTQMGVTLPDNQVNNMACGVLTVSGTPYIYCVGGSAAGQTTATARVFFYNPVTDTATTLTAGDNWPGDAAGTILPGGFTVVNNKLYILGGFNINVASTNQIWQFDPTAAVGSKWTQKVDAPEGIMFAPTCAIGGIIYVGGASDYSGGTVIDTTNSFSFNPSTNTIGTMAAIPRATGETRALAFNGKMLVMGGGRVAPNPSTEVDIYNPGTNTWTTGSPVPAFMTARRNFPTDTDGSSHIWLAGGYAPIAPTASMEIFTCSAFTFHNRITFNNRIVNAGFETGSFAPWVIDGVHNPPVVTIAQHHSGNRSALLGTVSGPEPLGDSSFYQQITVPAAGGTLSYWWWGGTTDTISFDWQDAYVTNTSGTVLATISHDCANTGGWVHQAFDMTPYAGQTVRIKFLVHEDGFGDDTWMYVDDVELTSPNANYLLYNASTRATAVLRLNNNVFTGSVFGPTLLAGWSLVGAADFNGSLNPDYLLFNPSTRQSAIWYLSGTTFVSAAFGPTLPSGWVLVTTADFNGDGHPDYVIYQPATRKTAIWYLNNNMLIGSLYGPTLPPGWSLVGAADFDGNGHPDYLLFNPSTRQSAIWYLSGTTFVGAAFGPTLPSGWLLVTTADFNRDGHPDYVLYQPATRKTAIWYLNNNVLIGNLYGPTLPAGWSLMDALPSVP